MIDISELKQHMYDVVGAIHDVHKELGAGLNEYCYQEGLQLQLEESGIPFQRELSFHPHYHGREMSAEYRVDFFCKDDIIVECKAVTELISNHRAQVFNYMRLLQFPCGILVNFAPQFATIELYFLDTERNAVIGTDGKIKQLL